MADPLSIERLEITALGHRGDGIAHGANGAVFVPYALPGEVVEVEIDDRHPDRGRLLTVEKASSQRVQAPCPHHGLCGGCALQHLETAAYRDWKRGLVIDALSGANIAVSVGEMIDAGGNGRRRATFHARRNSHNTLSVGFAAARSHAVIAIDRCPVLSQGLDGALAAAWEIGEALAPVDKPLDIQATATDGGLDIDVRGLGTLNARLTERLAGIAQRHGLARLTRHGDLVLKRHAPMIRIGKAAVELPPGGFLQATQAGEEALAELLLAAIGKAKTVLDLFCGVGPFALRLAERCKVIAADADAPAVAALAKAAPAPGLKPVSAQVRDLFRRPFVAEELKGIDVVVIDPPRQGAQAQCERLAQSKVPLLVMVSCNPTTFARDAAILLAGGYRLEAVTPVDQFVFTAHVELVGVFRR